MCYHALRLYPKCHFPLFGLTLVVQQHVPTKASPGWQQNRFQAKQVLAPKKRPDVMLAQMLLMQAYAEPMHDR